MIIKTNKNANGDYTGKDIYKMTKSNSIKKMSAVDGTLACVGFIYYEDEKADGSTVPILSIENEGGEVYATNSATFIRSFLDIFEMMQELPIDIVVGHAESKKGRPFIYCDLA